jgi:sulfur relay (sulfurtransferase) DsrC/TusE family protein
MGTNNYIEYSEFMSHFLDSHPEIIDDQKYGFDIYWRQASAPAVQFEDFTTRTAELHHEDDGQAFDEDGFMSDMAAWNVDVARRIAAEDGIGELDGLQVALLMHLRDHYLRMGTVPAIPHICHLNDMEPTCLSRRFTSPREAWRLAGLPNPGEEAKAYL